MMCATLWHKLSQFWSSLVCKFCEDIYALIARHFICRLLFDQALKHVSFNLIIGCYVTIERQTIENSDCVFVRERIVSTSCSESQSPIHKRVMGGVLVHIVPYLILGLNSLLFTCARKFVARSSSSPSSTWLSLVIKELIATLELCADCAELSVVWEVHGNVGLGITLFCLCNWWTRDWDDAEACPCGPIEESFLCGTPLTHPHILPKLVGQILAAYFTWQ